MKYCIVAFFIILFFVPSSVRAVVNPHSTANNKYGIHIIDENDLPNAASLVNSSGGDWGYVKLVIPANDRKVEKWQQTLNKIHGYHLIPIIRLATRLTDGMWETPALEDARVWAQFLDSLAWKTQNRYIIIFNEPNHAKEWGGYINPEGYARILEAYSIALKQKSVDFFILPAGLDASAPNGPDTMDEVRFIQRMVAIKPDIYTYIDGWTSHSYPNPGFRGKPHDTGRGSVATYRWERGLLKSFGINESFPVFIMETGWPHAEGIGSRNDYYSADNVAGFLTLASETIWNDADIVAITPFLLNYQSFPFSHFSWQMPQREAPDDASQSPLFYPQFDSYRSIPKVAGMPVLIVTPTPLPTVTDSAKVLAAQAESENTGLTSFTQNVLHYISAFISRFF